MALPNTQTVTIRPSGLSDAIDGSNAPPGAMAVLKDLIPNPTTAGQFIPRPASVQITNFSSFNNAKQIEALLVIGTRAYGFVASSRFAGKSEPYCYDLINNVFITLQNVTSANCPLTQPTTGDWEPPTVAGITSTKVLFTHPGYDGVTNFFGWIDISAFSYTGAATGDTHTSKTIDTLSTSVLALGWNVGMRITDSAGDIPANTFITNIDPTGLIVTISNAATASTNGVTFTVTGGTMASPMYGAGNTAPAALVARPVAVGQFNSRAYFCVQNGVAWSDSTIPLQRSLSTQAITLGDNTITTALGGNPVTSQLTGGIVQTLIVFKGGGPYWQITGDAPSGGTSTLAANQVFGSMGTKAPNTICSTPIGLSYVAQDGLRIIPTTGVTTEPIGANGQGVNNPFVKAVYPTRMCAAYNHSVIRISVQNGFVQGQPIQEYWYDINLQAWTGPHSFPAALISAYDGPTDSFVLVPSPLIPTQDLLSSSGGILLSASGTPLQAAEPGGLWQSDVWVSSTSTYTENGVAMTWSFQTCLSPDNAQAEMNAIRDSLLGFALPGTQVLSLIAQNEEGQALDTITISGPVTGTSIWGSFPWGSAPWGSVAAAFAQQYLPWHVPLVFKQMSLVVTGASLSGFVIGNLNFRYKALGYPLPLFAA